MTRINVVPPEHLTDQHLIAEYRELPRVFPLAERALGRALDLPSTYVLGKGHVQFFYPRTDYLAARFDALVSELKDRGFKVNFTTPRVPLPPLSGWEPSLADMRVNLARLSARLAERPSFYTHRKAPISVDFYERVQHGLGPA